MSSSFSKVYFAVYFVDNLNELLIRITGWICGGKLNLEIYIRTYYYLCGDIKPRSSILGLAMSKLGHYFEIKIQFHSRLITYLFTNISYFSTTAILTTQSIWINNEMFVC